MSDIKWPEFRSAGEIGTPDELLRIIVDPGDPMPIGAHYFVLTVVDDSGNISQPAKVQVVVRDTAAPTAVVTAYDMNGRPLRDNTLEYGSGFMLNAKGSVDLPPGKIVKFVWSLVAQ